MVFLFLLHMIEEFHQILRSPNHSSTADLLSQTQDHIINAFQQILPPTFEMSQFHKIYQQVLGDEYLANTQQMQISLEKHILLNHKLVLYFVEVVKNVYQGLQEQTQKAEATIRSHIKVEQQMKMYLQYLESKLQKVHKELETKSDHKDLRRQIQILTSKEAALLKQKISLIKANQRLRNQISNLVDSKTISPIKSHKQLLHPDRDAHDAKSKGGSEFVGDESSRKNSEITKQKDMIVRERDQSWHQDLTAKKRLTYFN